MSVLPLAARCAVVVVGVRGCRDIIFEEALDITGGGDQVAGPTAPAPIMEPHLLHPPPYLQIPPKLEHVVVAGLPDKTHIYGQILLFQLKS